MFKQIISSVVATTLLLNANVITIGLLISSFPAMAEEAQPSETPLLDRLRARYNLDDPYRNHRTEGAITGPSRPTSNRPTEVMQRALDNPRPTRNIGISGFSSEEQSELRQRSWAMAAGVGQTHTQPSINENGNFNAVYADRGTREFYRDENGRLRVRVIEGAEDIQYRTQGVSTQEMFSQELENSGVRFGADEAYGDEDKYYQEGEASYNNLTNPEVRTGESFAYRALTHNPNRALNTSAPESLLTPGFSYLDEANRQGGGFWGACQDSTTVIERNIDIGETSIEYCFENQAGNTFYCEIEREVSYEHYPPAPVMCEPEPDSLCSSDPGYDGSGCFLCYAPTSQCGFEDGFYWGSQRPTQTQGCSVLVESIKQTPDGCYDRVGEPGEVISIGIGESFNPTNFELKCTFDGYTNLEVGTRGHPADILDQLGPLYPGDEEEWTWRANLDGYRCNPLGLGHYCPHGSDTTDPESECITYDDLIANPSTCLPYIEDDNCSEIDRVCADGMWDEELGICWMESVRFECTDGSTFTRTDTQTTNSCQGMLPCIDGNCYETPNEESDDFEKALAMASILEDAGAEGGCMAEGEGECIIFKGEARSCRYDITGLIPNCCKDHSGTSIMQYIAFAKGALKVEQMAYKGEFGTTIQGAWAPIRDGAASAWQKLPFTSASESVEGAAEAALSDNSWIAEKMMEAIYKFMPESWAEVFVTQSVSNGETTYEWSEDFAEFSEWFGNVFGTIMFYYQMYQYIKLALNIIYACPRDELDMGALIAGGQCFEYRERRSQARLFPPTIWYTEYHCCYSSTLARIVMEQAHPLLDIPLEQCSGLTPDMIEELDWDQIDFSEWIDLMFASELVLEESMEGLTGSGRTLNNLGDEEDDLSECPEGYTQENETTCKATAPFINGTCPSTHSFRQFSEEHMQFVQCDTPLISESDSFCHYGEQHIPMPPTSPEAEASVYICPANDTQKQNFGCPDEFHPEDGQCVSRLQLSFGRRVNALERTQQRFNFDLDGTRREMRNEARQPIDCSVTPRPPICRYGFDPRGN